jgi:hypothetical protein
MDREPIAVEAACLVFSFLQRERRLMAHRFAVRRIIGSGDLWVTEFVLSHDGKLTR